MKRSKGTPASTDRPAEGAAKEDAAERAAKDDTDDAAEDAATEDAVAHPAPIERSTAGTPRRRNIFRRAPAGWVAFWDRREPPTTLALVRILVAAVLLADLLQSRTYGLVEAIWGPPPEGLGWGGVGNAASAAGRWFGASNDTAWLLWWTGVISSLCLIAGFLSRISAVVLALTWAQLGWMSPDSDRGIDFLLRAVLMVLAASQCHARWSVDAWLRRRFGRPFPDEVPAWPRYLLLLQLVWVYFSAGHNKTDGAWGPLEGYSALANILTDPHFARFDPSWIAPLYPLLQIATALTMVFELGSPLMLPLTYWSATRDRPGFLRRWANRLRLRWVWIFLGINFHIGIGVTMRLGIFPWGMMALFPVLFHPEELIRAEAWVMAHLPRPRSRSIAPGSPAG